MYVHNYGHMYVFDAYVFHSFIYSHLCNVWLRCVMRIGHSTRVCYFRLQRRWAVHCFYKYVSGKWCILQSWRCAMRETVVSDYFAFLYKKIYDLAWDIRVLRTLGQMNAPYSLPAANQLELHHLKTHLSHHALLTFPQMTRLLKLRSPRNPPSIPRRSGLALLPSFGSRVPAHTVRRSPLTIPGSERDWRPSASGAGSPTAPPPPPPPPSPPDRRDGQWRRADCGGDGGGEVYGDVTAMVIGIGLWWLRLGWGWGWGWGLRWNWMEIRMSTATMHAIFCRKLHK